MAGSNNADNKGDDWLGVELRITDWKDAKLTKEVDVDVDEEVEMNDGEDRDDEDLIENWSICFSPGSSWLLFNWINKLLAFEVGDDNGENWLFSFGLKYSLEDCWNEELWVVDKKEEKSLVIFDNETMALLTGRIPLLEF